MLSIRQLAIILSVFLILTASCDKEVYEYMGDRPEFEKINFANLVAGQRTDYVRFSYDCDGSFIYVQNTDSLRLEVLRFDDGFYIQEKRINPKYQYKTTEAFYRIDYNYEKIAFPLTSNSILIGSGKSHVLPLSKTNKRALKLENCGYQFESGHLLDPTMPTDSPGHVDTLDMGNLVLYDVLVASPFLNNPCNNYWLLYNENGILMSHDDNRYDGPQKKSLFGWIQTDLVK